MTQSYFNDNEPFSTGPGDYSKVSNTLLDTGALATNRGGVEITKVPADIQAGPDNLLRNIPTFVGQIGTGLALSRIIGQTSPNVPASVQTEGADLGPMTNFDLNAETPLDVHTQAAASYGSRSEKVANTLDVATGTENAPVYGLAAGEKYMSDRLNESFNPEPQEGLSLSRVPTAELSSALSRATGGVRSSEELRELIKSGFLGATTPRGIAGLDRLGQR